MSNNTPPTDQQLDEEIVVADQTQFSAEEPLYEAVSLPTKPVADEPAIKPKGLSKQQLILIAVGLVAVLILIITLAASMMTRPEVSKEIEPTQSTTPQQSDALQQRIDTLRTQVQAADPSLDALPLPPVDLELRLEKQ